MRKLIIIAASLLVLAVPATGMAAPPGEVSNAHAKSVNNTNSNKNACWGQDRSFYASASDKVFEDNMDIKQSFPTELGKVSDQKAAWIAQYC